MAQVEIIINGQTFRIACEDGQEARLADLALLVDGKVSELVTQVGQAGQHRLLVMAALVLADELVDLRDLQISQIRPDKNEGGGEISSVVENLAKRIENIADRVDRA
ncbi:MAG: cell division protein ZapA [Rhodospirillaceae bacterium]|nr:cell division protein ZapA [Rhodospirillaceae bacterium]